MHFTTFLFKNLQRRLARTILTCLGIGAAVGTTISLLGVSDNFRRETQSGFTNRGIDIVVIQNVLDQLTSDLPDDTGAKIEAAIPEVEATASALLDIVPYNHRGSMLTFPVQGWRPDGFLMHSLKIVSGRLITDADVNQIMIGKILAGLIEKKVGDKVVLNGEEFEIVGVFESTTLQENRCAIAILPRVQQMFFRKDRITGLSVRLKKESTTKEEVKRVCGLINALKNEEGNSLELEAQPTNDYVDNAMHIQVAQSMAWMTSIIAIIVGAIGMVNTMVMSVVERTREISILRAIGWRRSRIVAMIVGESLMLSLGGTIVGAIGASILVWGLVQLPEVSGYLSADIPWTAYVKGICLAFLVGAFGGLYPALRAAMLMPSEGLRHE
jgi:putative ABC transport system permease protein